MSSRMFFSFTLAFVVTLMIYAAPACAQSILGAAAEVESSIQSSMSNSGSGNGPTLGQLGGIQAGSMDGGGQGSEGSSRNSQSPTKQHAADVGKKR